MLETDDLADKIAVDNKWVQESNSDALGDYIKQAIMKYPDKVVEYKAGKKGLIGLFMGEVMKLSKGQADPKITNKLLQTELEK
jgi:aspartyl-tRNA(Asn)/glutamyl-tRNA(Gln) amidotransferase subunit B